MKRKILLILLVVCLVLGGIGGAIYAKGEKTPIVGDKLVGQASVGSNTYLDRGSWRCVGWFDFMNPDSEEIITIKEVRVQTQDGTVIYQGPFVPVYDADPPNRDWRRKVVTTLYPHETARLLLQNYKYTGDDLSGMTDEEIKVEVEDMGNWDWDFINQGRTACTVEITYESESGDAPLIGWQREWNQITRFGEPADLDTDSRESPMINVIAKN